MEVHLSSTNLMGSRPLRGLLLIVLIALATAQCGPGQQNPYPPGLSTCPPPREDGTGPSPQPDGGTSPSAEGETRPGSPAEVETRRSPPFYGGETPSEGETRPGSSSESETRPGPEAGGDGEFSTMPIPEPGGTTTPTFKRPSGQTGSSSCVGGSKLNCAVNGSSTFVSRALRYDSETGKMNGTITTNQCPDHEVAGQPAGKCVEQTIPDPSFRTGNIDAAPLLGRVAMALRTGGDIFGPMDNGFEEGRVCEGGSCVAGTDLHSCKSHLEATCTGEINAGMLMDRCGGHASPYHFHKDLACHYRASDDSVHSPAVAVALDGHLIYGKWEGSRKRPILDACNGHTGIVPSSDYHEAGTEPVYHYHLTPTPPFVLGCFGPADSIKACRAQYPACLDDAYATRMNAPGSPPKAFEVRRWCTCYQHKGSTLYGNLFEPPADSDTEEDVPSLMGPGNPDRAANAAAGEQSDRAADAAASEDRTERETTPAPTPGRGRPSRPRTRDVVALVVGLPFSREEFDEVRPPPLLPPCNGP